MQVALLTLIEDPDPEIRKEIGRFFQSNHDFSALVQLEVIMGEVSSESSEFIQELYLECKEAWFRESLIRLVSEDRLLDHRLLGDVLIGMNVLFAEQNQALDARMVLDNIIQECIENSHPYDTDWDKLSAINQVLYVNHRFTGNHSNYYHLSNSDFTSLLKTKQGIPVSLSMLYLIVGRACGINLHPAALPRHFMLCLTNPDLVFIDCYNSGAVLNPADISQFLSEINIQEPIDSFLFPTSSAVIRRIFQNLIYLCNSTGDEKMLSRLGEYLALTNQNA